MELKRKRIGDVEVTTSNCLGRFDLKYIEFVKYYPNSFYGREKEYEFDKENNCYRDREHHYYLHQSCFKDKESRYTIAIVEFNKAFDEYDIKSVGTRAFELSEKDEKDFKELLKYFDEEFTKNEEVWRDEYAVLQRL